MCVVLPNFLLIFLNFSQHGGVRRVRSKKRNDGSALGVVYAPLVSVMHAGFSTTLCSRHTYIHANTKQYTQPGVSYTIVSTEQDTFDCSAHC